MRQDVIQKRENTFLDFTGVTCTADDNHLFGHVHGNVKIFGRAMDVGIDARPQKDMGLWSWDEIHQILIEKPILPHHGKIAV